VYGATHEYTTHTHEDTYGGVWRAWRWGAEKREEKKDKERCRGEQGDLLTTYRVLCNGPFAAWAIVVVLSPTVEGRISDTSPLSRA